MSNAENTESGSLSFFPFIGDGDPLIFIVLGFVFSIPAHIFAWILERVFLLPDVINGWHKRLDTNAETKRQNRWKKWDGNGKKTEKKHRGILVFNWTRNLLQDRIRYRLDLDHKKLHNGTLNYLAVIFVTFYIVVTGAWMRISVSPDLGYKFSWNDYICLMLLIGAIHVWCYAMMKNSVSVSLLEKIFPDNQSYQERILRDTKNLVWPFPWTKGCTTIENLLKFLLFVIYCMVTIIIGISLDKLNIMAVGTDEIDTVGKIVSRLSKLFLLAGAILNYFSYHCSIVFCYLTREIANEEDIKCECSIPWNSKYLRDLVHISSRHSMSFFTVSMMYLITAVISVICTMPELNDNTWNYVILLLGATVSLCFISFLIISFLPKIFLNRLFRRWKEDSVRGLEEAKKLTDEKNKPSYDERISSIWGSNLPFVRMEVVYAFVSFVVNITSIVTFLLRLYGKI